MALLRRELPRAIEAIQDEIEQVAARYRVWRLAEDKVRLIRLQRELAVAQGRTAPLTTTCRIRLGLSTSFAGLGKVQTPITLRYRV